ncbi:MAG: hypothetical protein ABIH63_01505 [archaeon]
MIIHFWDLPKKRNYVLFNKEFKDSLLKFLENKNCPKGAKKIRNRKIRIDKLMELSKKEGIPLETLEKNICWIGGNNSKGLFNPKFPFNLSNRSGSRFIAAIFNDGTLTKNNSNSYGRLMYDNFDKSLRDSVIKDYLAIFGGNRNEIAFRESEKKKYLEFTSIIRDVMELILTKKGPKSENNIKIPDFIFENKENMIGWIEQTIADEGEIKYFPDKYRRAVVWRRSLDVTPVFKKIIKKEISIRKLAPNLQTVVQNQKCNLIESEKKILEVLGIKYRTYNLGVYPTITNKIRTRWQINIAGRKNLIRLRRMIKIPSKEKDAKLTKAIKGFVRYKEPLKIKRKIINICREKGIVNSNDLQKARGYKKINNASLWLKRFEKEGLIKVIKKSEYGGGGKQRSSAKYALIQRK